MISSKQFKADGVTTRFQSDFIIKTYEFVKPYVYIYDISLNPDGSEDVLQNPDAPFHYASNVYRRGYNLPQEEDFVAVGDWEVLNNSVSFYEEPEAGATVWLDVATNIEDFPASGATTPPVGGPTDNTREIFTATDGQTDFPVKTSGVFNNVYLNGALLVPDEDYTIDGVNSILVLTTPAYSNDTLIFESGIVSSGLDMIAQIPTIEDLSKLQPRVSTVVVKEEARGGLFEYDPTRASDNDGGTVFNGWVRQYEGGVNIRWFGAKGDATTDDTASIQKAIDYTSITGGTLYIPVGEYLVTKIDIPLNVNIIGEDIMNSVICGTAAPYTVGTSAKLFEQKFTNFQVSHRYCNDTAVVLMDLYQGANGCEFDLLLEGSPSSSVGGLFIRGLNPNDGEANNNQYNNKIRLRIRRYGTGEITGTALYLYGSSVQNARTNSNKILPGTTISNWSKGIVIRGALTNMDGVQINPCSDVGVEFLIDTAAESSFNTLVNTGFDGTWVGDKVRVVNNSDTYTFVANIIGSQLSSSDITYSGSFPTKATVGVDGTSLVLPYHNTPDSLDASLSGGVKRPHDYGLLTIQGGEATASSKILIGSKGVAPTQSISKSGITMLLTGDGTEEEFRINRSTNGTSSSKILIITPDNTLKLTTSTGRVLLEFDKTTGFYLKDDATNITYFKAREDGVLINTGSGESQITNGVGSPEGTITATVGSIYTNLSGGAGTTLYVKESGTGNTGWVAK